MASIYKRNGSPFWWIKFKDKGAIHQESTRFRHAERLDTKKARVLCAERSLRELKHARGSEKERWEAWVPDFLATNYAASPKTHRRYREFWANLTPYLEERRITFPSQLTYADCRDYVAWRVQGNRPKGVLECSKNTALNELVFLGMLMKHAVRRGFAQGNPASGLGIPRTEPRLKPEISDEHVARIRQELSSGPEWARIAFEISLFTGCRLGETEVPLSNVSVERRTIHFPHPKGGHQRAFSRPMPEELVPLFTGLIASGKSKTLDMPAMPSLWWRRFFCRIGLPQYSFHCLRVTFASRGAKAGIDERSMMRLMNHASLTVHRAYQRFGADDLRPAQARIPLPPPPAPDRNPDTGEATPSPLNESPGRQAPGNPPAASTV